MIVKARETEFCSNYGSTVVYCSVEGTLWLARALWVPLLFFQYFAECCIQGSQWTKDREHKGNEMVAGYHKENVKTPRCRHHFELEVASFDFKPRVQHLFESNLATWLLYPR